MYKSNTIATHSVAFFLSFWHNYCAVWNLEIYGSTFAHTIDIHGWHVGIYGKELSQPFRGAETRMRDNTTYY